MVVIVTDVYYKMALAIIRDLGEENVHIIACQSEWLRKNNESKVPVGFYSKYVKEKVWLPDFNEEPQQYIEALHKVCEEKTKLLNDRCVIIPAGAKTLQLLAEAKEEKFQGIGILVPSVEQLDLYNGKKEVAELASKLNIPVPREYHLTEDNFETMLNEIEIPCVVKPNCGEKLNLKAEQRYFIIRRREELRDKILHFYQLEGQYPVVQEFVDGAGVGLSVVAKDGEVVDYVGHKRLREYPHTGGPSTCCLYQQESILVDYAKRMVKEVHYTGVAMFEFKENAHGEYKLLEINPRVWGTYPMTRVVKSNFTYNWFALAYNEVSEKKLPIKKHVDIQKTIKMRYLLADIRAIMNYFRKHETHKAMEGIKDLFRPSVKDGVIELGDAKASYQYILSMLKK